jgi:sec-independent protein translocase protein TatB
MPRAAERCWSALVELFSPLNLLVLGVLALIIFGPDQLPKIASQAGHALRDLRRIAESAKADLREGLGPEFQDFDITELHPKNFVRKHLWEEFDGNGNSGTVPQPDTARWPEANGVVALAPGESPPYDSEAT